MTSTGSIFGTRQRPSRRAVLRGVLCLSSIALVAPWLVGCKKSEAKELPQLNRLPAFTLQDQSGRTVTLDSFKGKIWVAAFMFTRCPTICPRITNQMKRIQKSASDSGVPVHLVSISVDPKHDTPAVLREFAGKYDADFDRWSFLTGDFEEIRQTAEGGFKISVEGTAKEGEAHLGISHGSHLVLVDPTGSIRGYYRSGEEQEMIRLVADARRLQQSALQS